MEDFLWELMSGLKYKFSKKQYTVISAVLCVGILAGIVTETYIAASETEPSIEAVSTPSEATMSAIKETIPETIEEVQEEFVPEADKLNLAFYYPEGVDETDPLNSYAGQVYKELMTEDNEYLAGIYDSAGVSPRALADRIGVAPSRIMGKYNPSAVGQNPDDPGTWFIPNFKNVNVSFYNADGKRVNEYSNVKDIMAMASVYCYAHDYLDVETFRKYCRELYDKSRSYTISIGNVYYDTGCINRSAKEEAEAVHKLEKELEELKKKLAEDVPSETDTFSATGASESLYGLSESLENQQNDAGAASESGGSQGESVTAEADVTDSYSSSQASGNSGINGETGASSSAAESAAASDSGASQSVQDAQGNMTLGAGKFLGKLLSVQNMFRASGIREDDRAELSSAYDGVYYGRPGKYGTAKEYVETLKSGRIGTAERADLTSVTAYVSAAASETGEQLDTTSQANADSGAAETQAVSTSEADLSSQEETNAGGHTEETAETTEEESTDPREKYAKYKAGQGIDIINDVTEASSDEEIVETAEASSEGKESVDGDEAESASEDNQSSSGDDDQESSGDELTESKENGEIILGTFTRDELRNMDDATLLTLLEESLEAEEAQQDADQEVDVNSKKYCPGHVDLYVKVTIYGFEDEKGLRTIDLAADEIDENEAAKTLEAALQGRGWNGWTDERKAEVQSLIDQDWFTTYGLSISTINPKNPLTEEEISKYLEGLPDEISKERKAVIKFALESVGKVPYYWGGKATGRNYEANNFGGIVEADYRGRVLRGLDCSGWVQWVYWSALGNNLHKSNSTSTLIGEGEKINRADLQPGDIIVRIGADSHVVMFLGWAGNGNMIAIHENSGANNVSVNEVTANYPYYRKLIN